LFANKLRTDQNGWFMTIDALLTGCFHNNNPAAVMSYTAFVPQTNKSIPVTNDAIVISEYSTGWTGVFAETFATIEIEVSAMDNVGATSNEKLVIVLSLISPAQTSIALSSLKTILDSVFGGSLLIGPLDYLALDLRDIQRGYLQTVSGTCYQWQPASVAERDIGTVNGNTQCCTAESIGGDSAIVSKSCILNDQVNIFSAGTNTVSYYSMQLQVKAERPGVSRWCTGVKLLDPAAQCFQFYVPGPVAVDPIPDQYVIAGSFSIDIPVTDTGFPSWDSTVPLMVLLYDDSALSVSSRSAGGTTTVYTVTGTATSGQSFDVVALVAGRDSVYIDYESSMGMRFKINAL